MLTKPYIIKEIQALKPELVEKYHVTRIGLFGSFANGNPGEGSDIDILIDFEKPIGWDFFKIEKMFEDRFNRKIDLITPSAIKPLFKNNILNNIIEL